MNRIPRTAAAIVTAAGLSLTGAAGAAYASPAAAHAGANRTDVRFLKSNEQVNLAEITLAGIVLERSTGHRARALAHMTMKDHKAAMTANEKVAKADGITLPTHPNAKQTAAADKLSKTHKVALTYFKLQIAGHKLSIAQTKHELVAGKRHNVTAYARYYLPVAKRHLRMSERDLAHYRANH